MVDLDPVDDESSHQLRDLIEKHYQSKHSSVAQFILADFDNQLQHFVKVFPQDYKKVLLSRKITKEVPST
jgi:glutamate synthase (NADPH/NADH) large chain